jgi:hypothetical protein
MNTIFIGGSRRVSRLSEQVRERLKNVTNSGAHIIVGDANGADKAVQKFLHDASYSNVTVFCSGNVCRNNTGKWRTRYVNAPKGLKGFDFYATKDREMAREADFGLMIWDGISLGTLLNILRLIRTGKKAVLINLRNKEARTFKTSADWVNFISRFDSDFRKDLHRRATTDEWLPLEASQQNSFPAMP